MLRRSVAVVTDEQGQVVERLSYDPWGKRRYPNGGDDPAGAITSLTTKGFTGHEMIGEAGLINMNARLYDPLVARFMTPDSVVPYPFNSQSFNRYAYVHNGPLSATDPTGHYCSTSGGITTASPGPQCSGTAAQILGIETIPVRSC